VSQAGVTKNPWRGKIIKVSQDGKTVRVHVPTSVFHSKYKKILHRFIALHADTDGKSVQTGQEVDVLPCRRISKTKSWKVTAVHAGHVV
jgi:small subunit ribosomal protein S17